MDSFCCRCGARLSPGARFCHRCGHPCRPPERTGSSAAGKSMDWEGTAEKGLALLRRYWLAAALAVFAVIAIALLYAVDKIKKDNIIETLKRDDI